MSKVLVAVTIATNKRLTQSIFETPRETDPAKIEEFTLAAADRMLNKLSSVADADETLVNVIATPFVETDGSYADGIVASVCKLLGIPAFDETNITEIK